MQRTSAITRHNRKVLVVRGRQGSAIRLGLARDGVAANDSGPQVFKSLMTALVMQLMGFSSSWSLSLRTGVCVKEFLKSIFAPKPGFSFGKPGFQSVVISTVREAGLFKAKAGFGQGNPGCEKTENGIHAFACRCATRTLTPLIAAPITRLANPSNNSMIPSGLEEFRTATEKHQGDLCGAGERHSTAAVSSSAPRSTPITAT